MPEDKCKSISYLTYDILSFWNKTYNYVIDMLILKDINNTV
jgi:hypothetical protein